MFFMKIFRIFSFGIDKEEYSVKSVNEISIRDGNYLQDLFELLKTKTELKEK